MIETPAIIRQRFSRKKPDFSWSFSARQDRMKAQYITHSYHRYPAKFIPQIVDKVIRSYSKPDSVICDPFGGCGTTLVESKILGRKSLGFDINPVAKLITQTKTQAIDHRVLVENFEKLSKRIEKLKRNEKLPKLHPRLQYWFSKSSQKKLWVIYKAITEIQNPEVKRFFLCAFSHILKNCSVWLMKSIKPTKHKGKKIPNPYTIFSGQVKMMIRKNQQFHNLLSETGSLATQATMKVGDARLLPLANNSVDLIITSPPYVTSYEYADLHQLSLLWFKYTSDLSKFRKKFIGTRAVFSKRDSSGAIANRIVRNLAKKDTSLSKTAEKYFADTNLAVKEMFRILKRGGIACIVIGNTSLREVPILNAEVVYEQMITAGFKEKKVIKREISHNMITPWRDTETGRFTNVKNRKKMRVYQYEYILVMKK